MTPIHCTFHSWEELYVEKVLKKISFSMFQIFCICWGKKPLLSECSGYEGRRWPPDMEGSCECIE